MEYILKEHTFMLGGIRRFRVRRSTERCLIYYYYRNSISLVYNNKYYISISSMSKKYGIPGWRLGWVVADKNIIYKTNNQTISLELTNGSSINFISNYLTRINSFIQNRRYIESHMTGCYFL